MRPRNQQVLWEARDRTPGELRASLLPERGFAGSRQLKVHEAKSAVARPQERKFPGFSFTAGRGQARHCAEASGSVQATSTGDHATSQGRQHENHDGGVGSVYAGLAQLFWILRNAWRVTVAPMLIKPATG